MQSSLADFGSYSANGAIHIFKSINQKQTMNAL